MSGQGIEVHSLTKRFGATTALKDISFSIGKGELFGVLGPDGAGKTTLCRILAAVMSPTEGAVTIGPFTIGKDSEKVKHHTGYMPHAFGLYGDLTVEENIDFYADIFRVPFKERKERMERILGFTGMAPFTDRRSQNLSGGMKQKLQLACALIHTPEYLILDEPTFGVDPVSRREFWKLLLELLKGGLTILVSTSYMDEAQRCHRIALLSAGKILRQGDPVTIISDIPGVMTELCCDTTAETSRAIETLSEVRTVTLYGDRIHALLKEGVTADQFKSRIEEKGFSALPVSVITPSLEDYFIYLIEEERSHAQ
ncbi:MAG: ABC transporter ATP-binding protein [Candidatus Eremiobacteraeota bacterium]|nr:ABC transporter ATP-binding protein [Candidatus Eremiobacteraeota bacterium]